MDIVGGGGVKLESHHLGDFLRIKEESTSSNGGGGRNNPSSGLTLLALLTDNRGPPPPADEPRRSVESSRTLSDAIREDEIGGGRRDGRRSWQQLRDKIRLRCRGGGGSAWSSDVSLRNHRMVIMTRRPTVRSNSSGESSRSGVNHSVPNSRVPISRGNGGREIESTDGRFERRSQLLTTRLSEEAEEERSRDVVEGTSLIALLAENDMPVDSEGSAYNMYEEAVEMGGDKCCVCLVRHKGAAFIPCGHTFCRVCSRELWVQRGNCPLCNNKIQEILDIF